MPQGQGLRVRRVADLCGGSPLLLTVIPLLFTGGCAPDEGVPGHSGLERQVEGSPVGTASDHWIEMKNLVGEWERTGLIFGYGDDFEECQKAIEGLARINTAREYRCVPAN